MFDRFNPAPLFRGHWRGLSMDNRDGTAVVAKDVAARAIFTVVPVGLAITAFTLHWKLKSGSDLLGGVALLAGGLLAAFGQLTSWRQRMFDSMTYEGDAEASDRNMIDESVAHLLLASFMCGVDAALIVIGLNVAKRPDQIGGVLGALIIGVSSHILLLFLTSVPRLYSAYANYNKVSRHISGTRE
jgi:hypothetical protein